MPLKYRQYILIYVCSLFTAIPATAEIQLPDIGSSSGLSQTQEYRTGEAILRNLRRSGGVLEDPLITEYINHLGYKLISADASIQQHFTFFVVNDADINAFALPGGFIGVNYGLILATESESELASVLAHEISHITQRHHARSEEEQSNIPVLAAVIAAIILGGQDPQVGQAALATAVGSAAQQQLTYSRLHEQEADRVGIDLLAAAGFDPRSMPAFFEKLEKQSRLYGTQPPEFLMTHPVTTSRIADARNRANKLPIGSQGDSSTFYMMQARSRVIANDNPKALLKVVTDEFSSGHYHDKEAIEYEQALLQQRLEHHQPALDLIAKLRKQHPERIAYILLQAELMQGLGKVKETETHYAKSLELYPDNRAIIEEYCAFLLKQNQPAKAKMLLRKALLSNRQQPDLHNLLSQAETALGNEAHAHEALAEYYYLSGHPDQALTQLKLALKKQDSMDFYQLSRIEARIQEVQTELRELAGQATQ